MHQGLAWRYPSAPGLGLSAPAFRRACWRPHLPASFGCSGEGTAAHPCGGKKDIGKPPEKMYVPSPGGRAFREFSGAVVCMLETRQSTSAAPVMISSHFRMQAASRRSWICFGSVMRQSRFRRSYF